MVGSPVPMGTAGSRFARSGWSWSTPLDRTGRSRAPAVLSLLITITLFTTDGLTGGLTAGAEKG